MLFSLRRSINRVVALFYQLGVALLVRGMRYDSRRVGHATFWGTPEFLKSVDEALNFIQIRGPDLYESLKNMTGVFWYSPKASFQVGKTFAVCEAYLAWGRQGILTRVVSCLMKYEQISKELFVSPQIPGTKEKIELANKSAAAWLERNGIDEALLSILRT